jgi:hypothetical protein
MVAMLSALAALALPASSMAFLWPPNAKYEINGSSYTSKVVTPVGSCYVQKIAGTVPAEPQKTAGSPELLEGPVTFGGCSEGMSVKTNNVWGITGKLEAGYAVPTGSATIYSQANATESVGIRSTSQPGCVLSGWLQIHGRWVNALVTNTVVPSTFNPETIPSQSFVWANDGPLASCALKGTKATLSIAAGTAAMTVNTLTGYTPVTIQGNS